MDTHRLAQVIASLILANCEAYHARTKSHAAWDREQRRLWTLAERKRVAHRVKEVLYPAPMVAR